jgi:hypothetical protein
MSKKACEMFFCVQHLHPQASIGLAKTHLQAQAEPTTGQTIWVQQAQE